MILCHFNDLLKFSMKQNWLLDQPSIGTSKELESFYTEGALNGQGRIWGQIGHSSRWWGRRGNSSFSIYVRKSYVSLFNILGTCITEKLRIRLLVVFSSLYNIKYLLYVCPLARGLGPPPQAKAPQSPKFCNASCQVKTFIIGPVG